MINEEQWEKIIGSGSAVRPNAFGSGWAAKPKESWPWLDNLFSFKIFSILFFFLLFLFHIEEINC
jgi:hypothetical protein